MEAQRIAELLLNLGGYDNTAILYRTNAQSLPFEQAFKKLRIPFKLVGSLQFYDREEVKDALSL
ncbi:DNA helicase, UvrD/REP type, partial [gut metagenome]